MNGHRMARHRLGDVCSSSMGEMRHTGSAATARLGTLPRRWQLTVAEGWLPIS